VCFPLSLPLPCVCVCVGERAGWIFRWLFRHAGWSLVAGRWGESAAARGGVRLGVAAAGEVAPKPGRELLVSTNLESRGAVKSTKKLSKCRKQAH
jgi:hypothetical protein